MKRDYSYGIIPLKKVEGEWHALLIKHQRSSFWGFPKGHAEEGEEPYHTAVRELAEETGLTVKHPLSKDPLSENYRFKAHGRWIEKTVVYFIAEVAEGDVVLQKEEIEAFSWVPLKLAESQVTFEQAKHLCREVCKVMFYNEA